MLNKDLNFCPTPGKYNKRKIKLKAHFKTTELSDGNFYIKSSTNKQ